MNDFPRFDLGGQTALVTGASRGIGHDLALALAHAGATTLAGVRPGSPPPDGLDAVELGRASCRERVWIPV